MKTSRIKSVSWEYSRDEEYQESNQEENLKYSSKLAVFPLNRLDPTNLGVCEFTDNYWCGWDISDSQYSKCSGCNLRFPR